MKQFDTESIASRFIEFLSQTTEWSQLIGDSATVSLSNAIGETNSEIARYVENLLSESKWTTAMNISSYATLASYLGYVPQKRVSSLGSIYVSHDPNITLIGSSNVTLSSLS